MGSRKKVFAMSPDAFQKPIMSEKTFVGSRINPNGNVAEITSPVRNRPKEGTFRWVDIDKIIPNPEQPRVRVDEEYMARLQADIEKNGIDMPPVVIGDDRQGYISIMGHQRIECARRIGWEQIMVKVHPKPVREWTRKELAIRAMAENMFREELTDYEKALKLLHLTEKHGMKLEEASEASGIPYATARGLMMLVNDSTPEVLRKAIVAHQDYYTVGRVKTILDAVRLAENRPGVEKLLEDAAVEQIAAAELVRRLKALAQRQAPKKAESILVAREREWGSYRIKPTATTMQVRIKIKRKSIRDADPQMIERMIEKTINELLPS